MKINWNKYIIALIFVFLTQYLTYLSHSLLGSDDIGLGWLFLYFTILFFIFSATIIIGGLAKKNSIPFIYSSFLGISTLIYLSFFQWNESIMILLLWNLFIVFIGIVQFILHVRDLKMNKG